MDGHGEEESVRRTDKTGGDTTRQGYLDSQVEMWGKRASRALESLEGKATGMTGFEREKRKKARITASRGKEEGRFASVAQANKNAAEQQLQQQQGGSRAAKRRLKKRNRSGPTVPEADERPQNAPQPQVQETAAPEVVVAKQQEETAATGKKEKRKAGGGETEKGGEKTKKTKAKAKDKAGRGQSQKPDPVTDGWSDGEADEDANRDMRFLNPKGLDDLNSLNAASVAMAIDMARRKAVEANSR